MVSSCCGSTFRAGETDGLATQVVAVGFNCPMLWLTMNAPLAQALWLLLQLCSKVVGGSINEDIILTQLEGRLSSRTSASLNEVRGSMAHQSFGTLSTSWQDLPGIGSWVLGTWHRPGSSWATSVSSLVHQTSHLERTKIGPIPKSGWPAVLNSCWLPLGYAYSPWVTGMMPKPSLQTPGCHSGWGPQRALATILGCQAASHAT